jgi:Rieske Fe-S protein
MGTTTNDSPAGARTSTAGVRTSLAGWPTRRDVLVGAGLLAGAGVLAACGAGAGRSPSGTGASSSATSDASSSSAGGASDALAAVADVPVGGAVSSTLDGKPILLTKQQAGTVVGLSAICTHQGCTVASDGGRLLCPCHGSVFALDGSVVSGPAPSPLPSVAVHVEGGEVLAGEA